jgi:amidase
MTADATAKGRRDYRTSLDATGLHGARIGVVRKKLMGYSPAADAVMEAAIADMTAQGAVIVDPADIPTLGEFDDSELEVLLYEFKADLNKYLTWLGPKSPVHSLAEIIAFNEQMKVREMPYFAQELMRQAQQRGPLTDKRYLDALAKNHDLARAKGIDAVMDEHKLDALIAPTGGPAWLTDLVNGDYATNGSSSAPAVAGYPHITVPAGYFSGLPIGVSFMGRAWSEPTLIRIAFAFEQATKRRHPPTFQTSVK